MSSYEIQGNIRIISEHGTRSFRIVEDNSLLFLVELSKELPVSNTEEYEAIKQMVKFLEEPT
jgi:hypothetical protein